MATLQTQLTLPISKSNPSVKLEAKDPISVWDHPVKVEAVKSIHISDQKIKLEAIDPATTLLVIGPVHWPPDLLPPECRRCGADSKLLTGSVCQADNPNGNAGRPYVRCAPCNRFICFADHRGLTSDLECLCGQPARRQVSGRQKLTPRGLHFVCASGRCELYEPEMCQGWPVIATEEEVEEWRAVGFI